MAHAHSHSHHDHGHAHAPANFDQAFAIGIALNIAFVAIEAGYGFAANSLALLADAGHNLSDVLGLVIAWAGAWAARRRPSKRFTYGFRRSSIIASVANALALLIAIGVIQRFADPQPVASGTVMTVAGIGILINAATAYLFFSGRKQDINIRGAYLHMAADAAVSAGVVIAALIIGQTGWLWIDPATSLVVAAVIALGTWGLLTESARLSLDAVPDSIDHGAVEDFLRSLPMVADVHHVHIWAMSTTEVALTAHLVRPGAGLDDRFLHQVADELDHRFGIAHATIQIEANVETHDCERQRSAV